MYFSHTILNLADEKKKNKNSTVPHIPQIPYTFNFFISEIFTVNVIPNLKPVAFRVFTKHLTEAESHA